MKSVDSQRFRLQNLWITIHQFKPIRMNHSSNGTIKPKANFDADAAAESIEKALTASGCDEVGIIQIIAHINNAQRQMIRTPYSVKFGKDLIQELKKKLSGDFEDTVVGLMETPTKFDAMQLRKAMKGLGTNESVLIDILCSRNTSELEAIANEYQNEFGKSLEEDIISDTSGDFKNLLVALLHAKRDSSFGMNQARAREASQKMFSNKEKKGKPDKDVFVSVFSTDNFRQLRRIFSEYLSMHGETIQDGIERAFSGDARDAYIALVNSIENKPRFFAKQLHAAMKGLGTNNNDLRRIIISRSEIDLGAIKSEFENMYKKQLLDSVKSECSGPYRDLLATIIAGN